MVREFKAILRAQQRNVISLTGNDPNQLLVKLMCQLEKMNSYASFVIVDSLTGETVHQGVKDCIC